MRATRALAVLLIVTGLIGAAPAMADEGAGATERAAIEAAARDYVDGWYEGNPERMARALHPDLAKRSVKTLPNGAMFVQSLSYTTMVEYTRAGFGKAARKERQVNQVTILDVSQTMAAVKTVSPDYIDYLQLAKINGQWRIVNVLWEPAPKPAPTE